MKRLMLIFLISLSTLAVHAQNTDSTVIRGFYNQALSSDFAYTQLEYLCHHFSGRICCSPEAAGAIEWSKQLLQSLGADTVYLQECKVRCWKRGEKEQAQVNSPKLGIFYPEICALGGSIGTGNEGIRGEVVEVHSMDELKNLGKSEIKGKIVFFNRPEDPMAINTFVAYGGAADQRVFGAREAAKYGATGVVVRSLTLTNDNYPHTGIMRYGPDSDTIPAIAIGTANADILSKWLKEDPKLQFYFRTTCHDDPEGVSYNVIAEKRGTVHPEKIICFGGHIDAWDNGAEGAHDDGVGVMHNIEAFRLLLQSGIKPQNTLRVIVFIDEEMEQRGGKKYAEVVKAKGEQVIAAIESDAGGFTPTGFSADASEIVYRQLDKWRPIFLQYGLYDIIHGHGGVDIYPLKELGVPLFGLMTDSQRYFDYQHAASDKVEAVNRREMQLGSASIAMLVYLIDKYGYK